MQSPGAGDDRLLDLIHSSMARTRELVAAGRLHLTATADMQASLDRARSQLEAPWQSAQAALSALRDRLGQLENETTQLFGQAGQQVAEARQQQAVAQKEQWSRADQVEQALTRLRVVRESARQLAQSELSASRQQLEEAVQAARLHADQIGAQVRSAQELLQQTRLQLADTQRRLQWSATQCSQGYAQVGQELSAHWAQLSQDFQQAERETRQRLDKLRGEVLRTAQQADAVVGQRFLADLGTAFTNLSQELNGAVGELRQIAVKPHKVADNELLAMIQKLRETLGPLQDIEKVFRETKKAELC